MCNSQYVTANKSTKVKRKPAKERHRAIKVIECTTVISRSTVT